MIKLKPLTSEDLIYRVSLLNHQKIAPHINTKELFTLERTEIWFEKIKENDSRRDFVFVYKDQNVGMGGLTNISKENHNCELYMYIDPSYHGKGLGYKFCSKLCSYAFDNLALEKVYLYTFSENIPANKLYEKLGFKLEGVLRNHTFKDGQLRDRNFYGLLKNEL